MKTDDLVKSNYTLITDSEENTRILFSAVKEIKACQRKTLINAVSIGKNLIKIKDVLWHGSYEKFIENEFGFSIRSALNYTRVATSFGDFDEDVLSNLSPRVAYQLASPNTDDSILEKAIAQIKEGKKVSQSDLNEWTNEKKEREELNKLVKSGMKGEERTPLKSVADTPKKETPVVNSPKEDTPTIVAEQSINPPSIKVELDVDKELIKIRESVMKIVTKIVQEIEQVNSVVPQIRSLFKDDNDFALKMKEIFRMDETEAKAVISNGDLFFKHMFRLMK